MVIAIVFSPNRAGWYSHARIFQRTQRSKGQNRRCDGMVDLGFIGNGRDSQWVHTHGRVPVLLMELRVPLTGLKTVWLRLK